MIRAGRGTSRRAGGERTRPSAREQSAQRAGRGRTPTGGARRLLLLRHAKAEREPDLEDHERPLARRGHEDAERMAEVIAARRPAPELVLCSSSRRTRETLEAVLPRLPEGVDVEIDRELYLADPERILARIADVDAGVRTVLVVGHNPGIEELAKLLVGERRSPALTRLQTKFPTGALAEIEVVASRWRDVAPGSGMLAAFVTPRELGGRGR